MRKIYREKSGENVLIFRGTKYLLIIAAVMLAGAFAVTFFIKPSGKAVPESQSTPAAEEENVNIDNEWAMFLVNKENPLPDNYDEIISTAPVYSSEGREQLMDSRAAEYMKNMLKAAEKDGIELIVASAYRTMEYQRKNFEDSVSDRMENQGMTYEEAYADASRQVALPGESEHNAGLSADIFSSEYISFEDDGFRNTEAYRWLCEHADEYGFILRYPEDKTDSTGFVFEPWHYRFVGVYYASKVKESGLSLEEYFRSELNRPAQQRAGVNYPLSACLNHSGSSGSGAK